MAMRLTARTDYALRMMLFLGLKYPELTTIQEIADRYGMCKNHLMKITNDLAQDGWIESLRGRMGGIRLGRPTEDETALLGLAEERESTAAE